jgi:hypothetical protein
MRPLTHLALRWLARITELARHETIKSNASRSGRTRELAQRLARITKMTKFNHQMR